MATLRGFGGVGYSPLGGFLSGLGEGGGDFVQQNIKNKHDVAMRKLDFMNNVQLHLMTNPQAAEQAAQLGVTPQVVDAAKKQLASQTQAEIDKEQRGVTNKIAEVKGAEEIQQPNRIALENLQQGGAMARTLAEIGSREKEGGLERGARAIESEADRKSRERVAAAAQAGETSRNEARIKFDRDKVDAMARAIPPELQDTYKKYMADAVGSGQGLGTRITNWVMGKGLTPEQWQEADANFR